MCTWSYLHHHHIPPCTRPIDMVVHYSYCEDVGTDPVTGADVPCPMTYFAEDYQVDYNDPCATGGCLISPDCASGLCRLTQLGGRWACCACGGRGNALRACRQRLRTSPDTFCYHVCCETCRADASPPPGTTTTMSMAMSMAPSYSSGMLVPTSLSSVTSSATASGVVVTTGAMEGVGGGGGGSGTAVASGSGSGSSASGSRTRRGRGR